MTRSAVMTFREPLARVLVLGRRELPIGTLIGVCGALAVHGAALTTGFTSLFRLASYAEEVYQLVQERQRAVFEVEPAPPPEPPAQPEPEQVAEAAPRTRDQANQAPPAAAEAGKVLTQQPNPDEPIDLTDQGFVNGLGDSYAGGSSAANGTSKIAVHDRHAIGVAKAGAIGKQPGTAPTASDRPREDQGRAATPVSRSWNCGFPPEADFDQVDYATVMISVTVDTGGRAQSVNLMSDPGHGFGRLAKSCAMRMPYNAGLDKEGHPVVKTTSPFPVRFTR